MRRIAGSLACVVTVTVTVAIVASLSGCATNRGVLLTPSESEWARKAYESARVRAYAPRRFKALFRAEISPKVGAIGRGYFSIWWRDSTLFWRTSAPLAGTAGSGVLKLDRPAESRGKNSNSPFPDRQIPPFDAVGVLLGVLDLPAAGRPVDRSGERYRIRLDVAGRTALLDAKGQVVGFELPGGWRATLGPGDGVPRSIEGTGASGRAKLTLESYGPWPESEKIPNG